MTTKEYHINYEKAHKDERKTKKAEWYKKNKEKLKQYYEEYRKTKKDIIKDRKKEHYQKNKTQILNEAKTNYKNNIKLFKDRYDKNKAYYKEYRKKNKAYHKEYCKKNKVKINKQSNEYNKHKRKTDPLFRLATNTRIKLNILFKENGIIKKNKTCVIIGCSFKELKQYLESKFESWMNWENKGLYNGSVNYGWDIDHIIPLSSAKSEEELLKLCHYSNLQPLCGYINRHVKRNKINYY